MKENPRLNIKELALLKTNPEKYYKKYVDKSYSHKPHLQELPHDRRTNDPELLQERIDACDEKIRETETKIKEMEESAKYNENIYKKAEIDKLLTNCREFIDGEYSEEKLMDAIKGEPESTIMVAKQSFNSRAYDQLIDNIKSIDPELQRNSGLKNHPLTIEQLPEWYNDGGRPKNKELLWIGEMLTQHDHKGGGTAGPPGAELVPWTRDVRSIVEKTQNPVWNNARNHAHQTSKLAQRTNSILSNGSKEKADKVYSEEEIRQEKIILQDYKDEKKRTQDKKNNK